MSPWTMTTYDCTSSQLNCLRLATELVVFNFLDGLKCRASLRKCVMILDV